MNYYINTHTNLKHTLQTILDYFATRNYSKCLQVSTQPDQDGKSASKVKNHLDKKRDRETIQIVTKDLIRTLR